MEEIIAFIAEYFVELIIGGVVLFFNTIGRPKTAEKIKKAKEKTVEKLRKKCVKRVHACQQDEKRIEELEKELKKNA